MKAVIFDVDGVLVDSLEIHVQFCRDMAKRFGLNLKLPEPGKGKIIAITPLDNLLRKAGFPEALIPQITKIYTSEFSKHYFPQRFEKVHEMLLALKKEGFKLAIATSNYRVNVAQSLGESFSLFDAVYSKDVHSSKVDAVNDFSAKFGISKNEMLFVGDTHSDRLSAEKAGVKFVGVTYGWELEKELKQIRATNVLALQRRLIRERKVALGRKNIPRKRNPFK